MAVLLFTSSAAYSQNGCPPNIGVEDGTLNNWQCYAGSVAAVGTTNEVSVTASAPNANQHLVYSNMNNTTLDAYGLFPVACPNGSNYSIKLGNNQGGKGAERISYTFTIPATAQNYSLVYWYAVVFQNPDHQVYQQPRFVASVFNQQSGQYLACASFTYVGSSGLPGFEQSPVNREVIFKKWAPVTVNLSGYAGQTIRLEFTTADCTQGGHFGYAYIDIDEQCSQPVRGALYCAGSNTLTLTAPYGYQSYNWYNPSFIQLLGSQQQLTLTPPPPDSTQLAVEVIPYDGFGCKDTLYTRIKKVAAPVVEAGENTSICAGQSVTIGQTITNGLIYRWTPATALANSQTAITVASPTTDTRYTLTANDSQNDCAASDSVFIRVKPVPVAAFSASPTCVGSAVVISNTTSYTGNSTVRYAWSFANGTTSTSFTPTPVYTSSGTYTATLKVSSDECPAATTAIQSIVISAPPVAKSNRFSTVVNESITLRTLNTGSTYLWQPAIFLDDSDKATPIFTGTADKNYLVAIAAATGCRVVDTVQVKVEKEANILVPTGFTPNGDGNNDRLHPILFAIKQLQYFRIWNRWGLLLYETEADQPGWDGQYKSVLQPAGAYVWEVVGITYGNKIIRKKGLSMLIR